MRPIALKAQFVTISLIKILKIFLNTFLEVTHHLSDHLSLVWCAVHSRTQWKILPIVRTNQRRWLIYSFPSRWYIFLISHSHYQDLSSCSDFALPAHHIFSLYSIYWFSLHLHECNIINSTWHTSNLHQHFNNFRINPIISITQEMQKELEAYTNEPQC